MKKLLTACLAVLLICVTVFMLGACNDEVVQGPQEEKGESGKDEVTPTIEISEDGYWVINGEKTSVKAESETTSIPFDFNDEANLKFYLKEDGTYAVGLDRPTTATRIIIPSTYNEKPVTEIADKGFGSILYQSGQIELRSIFLTEIVIPNTVTRIGDWAFSGCYLLKELDIPESVVDIGYAAFNACSGFEDMRLPNSIISIDDNAFYGCAGLKDIWIPQSIKHIGVDAFYGCSDLENVYIEDLTSWCNIYFGNQNANPMSIAKNLHLNNSLITQLSIPNNVTHIGCFAFYNCKKIMSITLPKGITGIGEGAFGECTGLVGIYYSGSESEWKNIAIEEGNASLTNTPLYYR